MRRKSSKVKTTYQPAAKTPSARAPHAYEIEMRQPQPLPPLRQYILDNEGSGLSVHELTEQFQEYDCEHKSWSQSSWSPSAVTMKCDNCGKVRRQVKSRA